MKKFVTLALALIMALSIAAPAMAFTGIAAGEAVENPIGLAIRLVDVSSGFVSVNFDAPPSNRGYVKNEVVCAVVSMSVPKGIDPSDKYSELIFSGKNVSLYQDENFTAAIAAPGGKPLTHMSKNVAQELNGVDVFRYRSASEIYIGSDTLKDLTPSSDQTYHFAVFGKVLADDATMTATLDGAYKLTNDDNLLASGSNVGWAASGTAPTDVVANIRSNDIGKYLISYVNTNETAASGGTAADSIGGGDALVGTGEVGYFIIDKALFNDGSYVGGGGGSSTVNAYKALIVTDKNFVCKRMYVFDPAKTDAELGNELANAFLVAQSQGGLKIKGVSGDVRFYGPAASGTTGNLVSAAATENALVGVLSLMVSEFGFDPTISGVLAPEWWKGYEKYTVSVDIEPWYAEVTVPAEIELEIPKTGDALSVLGFVLIALAGAAVVALRKVRA